MKIATKQKFSYSLW